MDKNHRNSRREERCYGPPFDRYYGGFAWDYSPIHVMFRLLWIFFFFLVVLSIVMGILAFVFGISINWLGNAWGAWGGLWVVLLIFFVFFGSWRRWYRGYGYNSDEAALRTAKMRLAHGEITLSEYKRIVNEIKKK